MLAYSLARLRLPAKELYVRIGRTVQENFAELEAKDSAILMWAFTRVKYFGVSKLVKEQVIAKFESVLVQYGAKVGADETLYLEEKNAILEEIERNIVI